MRDVDHRATTQRVPGLVLTDHELTVPLDHARPGGPQLTVFAREVADPDGAGKPRLLYLEGGPGTDAPRPTRRPTAPPWLERALADFRVVLLDQRGTGRSTPVGTLGGLAPAERAAHLTHFRADSIVRDAELLRAALGGERWSVLGQSFGGFCTLTYLSLAPEGLREALFTGGLPPVGRPVDEVYRATHARVLERCERHFARFPQDRDRVRALAGRLAAEDVRLPGGDRLTPERLRQHGNLLGQTGGSERLHFLLERPVDSPAFLHDAEHPMPFARNPLYAVVHEACYADGGATRWSAHRTLPAAHADRPELLTGEHVFPWMFEQYGALAPLRETAGLLAEHEWPRLYDPAVLVANEVPAAAAIYAEDLYVERAFSEETAASVRGLRTWITSELEHDGLRTDGPRVLGHLLDLARDRR